jgi:hypothetical protein
MKLNLTVVFTLILLALMLGAGSLSGIWAFNIGHQALKGVTEPDVRPRSRIKERNGTSQQQAAVPILKEEDILTSVKAWIEGKGKHAKPEKSQDENKNSSKQTPAQKTLSAAGDALQPGFPITTQNQGVTLKVLSARYSGGSLLLKLNFKNEGTKVVQFLYSFLDVTDDQGRTLSANTEGLPAELPANGQSFSGTVIIPTALLDDVKKLSLTLTDYPEQQLRLQLSGIPVKS